MYHIRVPRSGDKYVQRNKINLKDGLISSVHKKAYSNAILVSL